MGVTANFRDRPALPPNVYAIPFGIAGLAVAWRTAQSVLAAPPGVADVLFAAAAALWLALTADLLSQIVRSPGAVARATRDAVRSPFFALPGIVLLLLGVGLLPHAPDVARGVTLISVVVTVALGALLTGQWMTGGIDRERFHPGYLLPAVAGGLVAANAAVAAGYRTIGWLLFGLGMVSWVQVGPVILGRLFLQGGLPSAQRATLAIEVAPAAVAGTAYFSLHQGRDDVLTFTLAGYCVLMVLAQLRLISVYRRLTFNASFWAFAFSYTTVATYALRWLEHAHPAGDEVLGWAILAAITAFIGLIAVRSVAAVAAGRFLPTEPDTRVARSSGLSRPDTSTHLVQGAS
jgi:tellurite resistance protein